jgi:hypothetical protein
VIDHAHATLEALALTGINLTEVTDRLLEDGLSQFCAALDTLLAAIDRAGGGLQEQTVFAHVRDNQAGDEDKASS